MSEKLIMKYLGAIRNTFSICIIISVAILFFSFIGFLTPIFREVMFFVVLAAVLILSLYKLEYGLYAVIIELVLGSKGYLFYFDFDGFNISLRIGIFLIVLGVFFAKLILRRVDLVWKKEFFWLTALFVLIIVGYVQGLFRNYGFQNTFLDANGYFYLLYLFPFLSVFKDKEKLQKIKDVILSSGITLIVAKPSAFISAVIVNGSLASIGKYDKLAFNHAKTKRNGIIVMNIGLKLSFITTIFMSIICF